ncbi:hypothetical protein RSOLAG22IIIB_01849 [Rhizoctonia solani]|uniref:SHSP domain-containing protein n=1 Tax=Rhizoctonia solani TaxID=456999 RepID=A0A0K6GBT8_9AGAM|nr:unnamed protein product [Rhizoctonia solani]CUA75849.1 hypothetical protein RSOLAG22IIIB_01849 [Rhizoctonia solani]
MSSTRPPLTRNTTSPGALYGCRDRALSSPEDYCGSHGRAYGSVDGIPTCASPKPQSRYPTPPHTTSPPHSNASTPDSSDENMPRSTASPSQNAMNDYFPRLPSNPDVPIVAIRGSRSPTEDQRAQPDIQVSPSAYSLVAHIGRGFHPECITISAMKGNALVIVADRWDMEKDCRYEWVWRFDRDADMSSVHANFDSGVLRVTVRRIRYRLGLDNL